MWTKIQLWAYNIVDNSKKLEITKCPTTEDCLNTLCWMDTMEYEILPYRV